MAEAEAVLVALGRRSYVEGLGLARAGVRLNAHGQLEVNGRFQTTVPHIYAGGDVIGGPALSSTAMEQARMAMVNAFDLKYKVGHVQVRDLRRHGEPPGAPRGETVRRGSASSSFLASVLRQS